MKKFTVADLTRSDKAKQLKIENTPTFDECNKLQRLLDKFINPIAELYGGDDLYISSGFRNQRVNKAVGGAENSQHRRAEAVDLKCKDMNRLFDLIAENFDYDQLISEFPSHGVPQWVHCSFKVDGGTPRKQKMISDKVNGKTTYTNI